MEEIRIYREKQNHRERSFLYYYVIGDHKFIATQEDYFSEVANEIIEQKHGICICVYKVCFPSENLALRLKSEYRSITRRRLYEKFLDNVDNFNSLLFSAIRYDKINSILGSDVYMYRISTESYDNPIRLLYSDCNIINFDFLVNIKSFDKDGRMVLFTKEDIDGSESYFIKNEYIEPLYFLE